MFSRSKKIFQFKDIPDLSGKIAVITGASAGIGKVSALELARKNCNIVFACRNREKTKAVIKDIKEKTGNKNLEFIAIDMASLSSVQQFASEFVSKYDKLDILLNNAGVFTANSPFSKDGISYQFAVNHVAHHYLTMILLPHLQKSESSRIVNVSSDAHRFTSSLNLDKIFTEGFARSAEAYNTSKIANILFTRELSKRLNEKGIESIYVNCLHPGTISTDIFQHGMETRGFIFKVVTKTVLNYFAITPEEGVLTQVYLCTSPEVEHNNIKAEYYTPPAKLAAAATLATSNKDALELWEFTEKLIKEKILNYSGATI